MVAEASRPREKIRVPLQVATEYSNLGKEGGLAAACASKNAYEILKLAISIGDESAVSDLVLRGKLSPEGLGSHVPLIEACASKRPAIVKLLVSAGANVNRVHISSDGIAFTPIFTAVTIGDFGCVQVLLRYGARPGGRPGATPLSTGVAGAKLASGSDVLIAAAAAGESKYITPLAAAASSDRDGSHEKIVAALLEAGADPNEKSFGCEGVEAPPLIIACERNSTTIAGYLLNHKADANVECGGKTPLAIACAIGNDVMVAALLDCGADPRKVVMGSTPLAISVDIERDTTAVEGLEHTPEGDAMRKKHLTEAFERRARIARLLCIHAASSEPGAQTTSPADVANLVARVIARDGDAESDEVLRERMVAAMPKAPGYVNARDAGTGTTALHRAARRGYTLGIATLLDLGADIHAKSDDGMTALDFAAVFDLSKHTSVLAPFVARRGALLENCLLRDAVEFVLEMSERFAKGDNGTSDEEYQRLATKRLGHYLDATMAHIDEKKRATPCSAAVAVAVAPSPAGSVTK
jgi:ankyrin repeat protein